MASSRCRGVSEDRRRLWRHGPVESSAITLREPAGLPGTGITSDRPRLFHSLALSKRRLSLVGYSAAQCGQLPVIFIGMAASSVSARRGVSFVVFATAFRTFSISKPERWCRSIANDSFTLRCGEFYGLESAIVVNWHTTTIRSSDLISHSKSSSIYFKRGLDCIG